MYHQCLLNSGTRYMMGWVKGAVQGKVVDFIKWQWRVEKVYSKLGRPKKMLGWVIN